MSSPVKPWPRNVPHHLQVQACNLYENLARSAEADPQAPALIFHGAVLTYGELQRQVLELAGWMEQVAGHSAHEVRTWIAGYAALGAVGDYTVQFSYYRPIREYIAGFGITTVTLDNLA